MSGRQFTSSIYRWALESGPAKDQRPSRKALADLELRKAMPETRDMTGRLLGDPPAGRSALDRKRAAEMAKEDGNDH